jgi:hypothetical protein
MAGDCGGIRAKLCPNFVGFSGVGWWIGRRWNGCGVMSGYGQAVFRLILGWFCWFPATPPSAPSPGKSTPGSSL